MLLPRNFCLTALLTFGAFSLSLSQTTPKWIVESPAQSEYCIIDREGKTILPDGRFIQPYGKTITIAPHPFGLILSLDGQTAVTANSGTAPLSVTILDQVFSDNPKVRQIPDGYATDEGILASVFMGLAIDDTDSILYVSGGQENKIYRFHLGTEENLGTIDCSTFQGDTLYRDGYIGDLKLSRDKSTLYAIDQINFRLIVIDLTTEQVTANIGTGRYPFGLALSPDEKTTYLANVGMYEYSILPGVDPKNLDGTAWNFPPYAYGSEESTQGTTVDGKFVPGLGDPNAPESFSVWEIDLPSRQVTAKIKTGFLVGEVIDGIPAVGGASPNSLAVTANYVFVSNGNNDCISVIDVAADSVVHTIFLAPDERLRTFRGVIPFGLCLSPDQKTLYVAESGVNAVGVIDTETFEVRGHIPIGWFPSKLAVSPDGKQLVVANAKGYGSGPNGGEAFAGNPLGSYIGGLMRGSVTVMDIPDQAQLEELSQQVITNNFRFTLAASETHHERADNPIPLYPGASQSPIRHIVFVTKENRTYDEVFGQVSDGRGDPSLARYGASANFSNRDSSRVLEDITVMPNHLALAERFAISDNFYVNADHSADGHRWLSGTYPNEWVETSVPAAYGGNRDMIPWSDAPGALAFEGASGAIYPEDYNQAGSMWEHLERNNISLFNFGCGIMFAPHISGDPKAYKNQGYRYAANYPLSQTLFDHSSRRYPTYHMGIPDQYRIDQFIEEFEEKWMNGEDTLPQVLTVMLGADHGAQERPEAGYPFRESYMADNDLALGRLVEFLSQTPYWKSMAIVVTEDDSQGGVDHVDAHRSLLMVVSPYAKRKYVGHQHYSFGSIFKTFWNILGVPYLNQYDASATDLNDLFTAKPDFTPYRARPVDSRMFDPRRAYTPLDEEFNWSGFEDLPPLDDTEFLRKEAKEFDKAQYY
ncbi:MAG: alkaline phosphatase family protein [Bacteroidota bacterium]